MGLGEGSVQVFETANKTVYSIPYFNGVMQVARVLWV